MDWLPFRALVGGENKEILICGAGVLGSVCATRLYKTGQQVKILARGQRLADLRQHGLVMEDVLTGEVKTLQIAADDRLQPGDAYDLVIVAMGKYQMASVLPVLVANQHTRNVLFTGNIFAGPEQFVEALGTGRALSGILIAGVFEQAGFPVEICPNTDAWLKSHAALIVPLGAALAE